MKYSLIGADKNQIPKIKYQKHKLNIKN